jgi:iron-sulfur cluster assembly enzyme ISCU, mitochondrial
MRLARVVSRFCSIKRGYHQRVIDRFEHPKNIGSLDKKDPTVGTGIVGSPACGDVMKLQIRVENGKIVEAKYKVFGCGSAMASSDYATEQIVGKRIEETSTLTNKDIAKYLSLPPVKLHCSMLAEDAVLAAVTDYLKKTFPKP